MVKVELIYDVGGRWLKGSALRAPHLVARHSLQFRVIEALCLKRSMSHQEPINAVGLGIGNHELEAVVRFLNEGFKWNLPVGQDAVAWTDGGGFELHVAIEAHIINPEP